MTSEYVINSADMSLGLSPVRKRARYDSDQGDLDIVSVPGFEDDAEEHGVGRLDYDHDYPPSDDDTVFGMGNTREVNASCISMSPDSKEKQTYILEQVLSKETVQKLSMGEWGDFLIKKRPVEHDCSGENHFDKLPDELVLNVMRWMTKKDLGHLSRVCRRFRRLMEDESLWTRMDLSNRILKPGRFGVFLGRQIVIFRLARTKIMSLPILKDSKAGQPDFQSHVMYLDLSMAEVAPESLEVMFSKMRRLRKVSLENVAVTNDVLAALSHNSHLEVANLAMVTGIEKRGMEQFLKGCRQLRELNIAWTYLSSSCISLICENLPSTLDRLNFSGCKRCMFDSHVTCLVENCPNLRELDLSDCTTLTGKSLRKITSLTQLNFLSLSRCYAISYRDLIALKTLLSLQYLDIHGSFLSSSELEEIQRELGSKVTLNKFKFSSIARPTVGMRRSSIWNLRAHD